MHAKSLSSFGVPKGIYSWRAPGIHGNNQQDIVLFYKMVVIAYHQHHIPVSSHPTHCEPHFPHCPLYGTEVLDVPANFLSFGFSSFGFFFFLDFSFLLIVIFPTLLPTKHNGPRAIVPSGNGKTQVLESCKDYSVD